MVCFFVRKTCPTDLEQRSGRILRQGNTNPEVEIFRYVTEQTFDAYLYQLVENKQKFISQIMTSKSPVRSAEDIDETALSYAEIKALATGNPYIKEKMDLDTGVARLRLLKANHLSQRYSLEDQMIKYFPQQIKSNEERIKGYKADKVRLLEHTKLSEDKFSPMVVSGVTYTEKAEAGKAIIEACKKPVSKAKQLLKLEKPLDLIYQEWLGNDYSHMEMIEDTINDFADKLENLSKKENHLT